MFFLNGLLIQWGYVESSNELGNVGFTSTNYTALLTYDSSNSQWKYDFAPRVYCKTRSGFKSYLMQNPPKTYWLAIGY